MTTPEHSRRKLPIGVQDIINPASNAEQQRELDQIVTPSGKLAFSLEILPLRVVQEVVQMDRAAIYELILTGNEIPQEAQEPIHQLYAFLRILEREEKGDLHSMTRKLYKENIHLRKDPEHNPSITGRSAIQAMLEGDIERVLFVAEMSSQESHEHDVVEDDI